MASYNSRNTTYCENINEDGNQKFDFGLLESMNGQITVALGQSKCSGNCNPK